MSEDGEAGADDEDRDRKRQASARSNDPMSEKVEHTSQRQPRSRSRRGQLGNGSTSPSSTPVQAAGLSGAVSVAAGSYHIAAVKSDGAVWAWGYNYYGQLGNGSTSSRSTPAAGPPTLTSNYAYNGDGLRASKTVSGVNRRFVWDLSGPLPLLLHDGERSYLYGPDGNAIEHIADPSLVGATSAATGPNSPNIYLSWPPIG